MKKIDWHKVFTLKKFFLLCFLCLTLFYVIDFGLEFVQYSNDYGEVEYSLPTLTSPLLETDKVTIKYIASNNTLPEAVISGESFDSKNEHKLLEEINYERELLGLKPLYFDIQLERSARIRCLEMLENNYFDHIRPDGTSWKSAITDDVGISYRYLGENLARSISNDIEHEAITAQKWFEMWKNSETHYKLLLSPQFTHVGIGIHIERTDDEFISHATAHFADETMLDEKNKQLSN